MHVPGLGIKATTLEYQDDALTKLPGQGYRILKSKHKPVHDFIARMYHTDAPTPKTVKNKSANVWKPPSERERVKSTEADQAPTVVSER